MSINIYEAIANDNKYTPNTYIYVYLNFRETFYVEMEMLWIFGYVKTPLNDDQNLS